MSLKHKLKTSTLQGICYKRGAENYEKLVSCLIFQQYHLTTFKACKTVTLQFYNCFNTV